jgi:hypothetical protein
MQAPLSGEKRVRFTWEEDYRENMNDIRPVLLRRQGKDRGIME